MKRLFAHFAMVVATATLGLVGPLLCLNVQAAPAQPTKAVVTWTGRPEPVPIAFVYRDAVGDSAWTQSHELARKAVEAEFGSRVRTIAVERVASATDADVVFRDLAARGYKVFFSTHPGHTDAAAKIASADYDIKVEQVMGTQLLVNMRTYEIRHFEQAYLAGIIAAGSSATSKLGFIAAVAKPTTLAEINAFTLGAQSVNKRATTQVIWAGSQSDASADAIAAESLIKLGVDVLIATTDSMASAQVAERRNKHYVGWHADRSALALSAHVATVALDWLPFYRTAINESFDYMCTKTDTSRGFREGAIKVVGLSKSLSHTAKKRLMRVQTELGNGQFLVFVGPMRSNANALVLAANGLADEPWRKSMNFLARGATVVASAPVGPKRRLRAMD